MAIIAASVATTIIFSACSENIVDGLHADSNSNISLSVTATGLDNDRVMMIGSTQTATVFTVTSTTRWTVEITDCEGAWCQVTYGENGEHIGDGTFTVEAATNRSDKERECNITVYAIEADGTPIPGVSSLIHLNQDRQSIQVNYNNDVVSAMGTTDDTEPEITIIANQSWNVSSANSWVTIIPGEGMTKNGYSATDDTERTISFRLKVERNPSTLARHNEITVSSPTSAFTPIRLSVTQAASTETFFVTPSNVPIISNKGETIELDVYSPEEAWTVKPIAVGDWITLSRTSGEASENAASLTITVAPNTNFGERQGNIVFTRGSGKGETVISITQIGAENTVVSEPWIVSGWTARWAQLRAYYWSPAVEITGCGAYIHPVNDESASATKNFRGSLGGDNMIIVDLSDLEPKTEYKAWGYVEFNLNGETVISESTSITFTTPDVTGYPINGENTPPSAN